MLHAEWLEVPFEPGKIEVVSYKNGNAVPDNGTMLHFEASGNGELFGVDNGNAADSLSLKGKDKTLFNGKALAVIRSIKGNPGNVKLTVSSNYGVSDIAVKCK